MSLSYQQQDCPPLHFSTQDLGWVMMNVGMAIGATIVFIPVQVGLEGLWVFFLSVIIGYPVSYFFHRLFLNTLIESDDCQSYPHIISSYLGKNWGIFLSVLYFILLMVGLLRYAIAINNDTASYLYTFHITRHLLSTHYLYGFVVICLLIAISSQGERLLFKISNSLVLIKIIVVILFALSVIGLWRIDNIGVLPDIVPLIKKAIVTLPYTVSSVLFMQTLTPMVISYQKNEPNKMLLRAKVQRNFKVSCFILFTVVLFFTVSFTLAMGHEKAMAAWQQNISSLAITAEYYPKSIMTVLGLILNLFAVITAFFGCYLAFRDTTGGIITHVLSRLSLHGHAKIKIIVVILSIVICMAAIILNIKLLSFAYIGSPICAIIGCLLPAFLVYKVPKLHKYRGFSLYLIIFLGVLMCISPYLAFFSE